MRVSKKLLHAQMKKWSGYVYLGGGITAAGVLSALVALVPVSAFGTLEYASAVSGLTEIFLDIPAHDSPPKAVHIATPASVKAIYMSGWIAGTFSMREELVRIIDETEINAVVIDVKDNTGKISFNVEDPVLKEVGSAENRIPDIREFIAELHKKNVYVIGRIAVFQDPYFTKIHPEFAVRRGNGDLWYDRKGDPWLDAGAEPVWDYAVLIAKEAYAAGFDEINFDYVRFPSDGNISDMVFPFSRGRPKREVVLGMWSYLGNAMRNDGIPSSADVFGMTTTADNDMNIGQVFEDALPNFDFVAPMAYPSHYPDGFLGFSNPAAHPYEVIKSAIGGGVLRAKNLGQNPLKIRTWIQDFDMGAEYGAYEVREQIRALTELGLNSWMVWDPSNVYSKGAFHKE